MPAAVIALIFFLIGFWHLYWAKRFLNKKEAKVAKAEGLLFARNGFYRQPSLTGWHEEMGDFLPFDGGLPAVIKLLDHPVIGSFNPWIVLGKMVVQVLLRRKNEPG